MSSPCLLCKALFFVLLGVATLFCMGLVLGLVEIFFFKDFFIRAFYSAPRGEGDADFKIRGPATQKNYGNATAAPPEPGRNFRPAFGGAQYSKQNKNKL